MDFWSISYPLFLEYKRSYINISLIRSLIDKLYSNPDFDLTAWAAPVSISGRRYCKLYEIDLRQSWNVFDLIGDCLDPSD